MTREEAIEILEECWRYSETYKYTDAEIRESLDMAIKALEQEPCEDCISRKEALKHSHIEYDDDGEGHRVVYFEDIENLPSVTHQPCDDCISREAAIDAVVFECGGWVGLAREISRQLKQLPSFTQQQKVRKDDNE